MITTKRRDRYVCFACGLKDKRVEAGGLWFCPNPYCLGCGAFLLRTTRGYQTPNPDTDGATADDSQLRRMLSDCDRDLIVALDDGDIEQSRVLRGCSARIIKSLKRKGI